MKSFCFNWFELLRVVEEHIVDEERLVSRCVGVVIWPSPGTHDWSSELLAFGGVLDDGATW